MNKLFSALGLIIGLTLFSCKDACKDVTCLNGATCDDGVCQCTEGYEGDDCGTESRAKYFGTYMHTNISYECTNQSPYAESYQMLTIVSASSTSVNHVMLLTDEDLNIEAELDGSNYSIPAQNLYVDGDVIPIGASSGFFESNGLNLNILLLDETDPSNSCLLTSIGTK